MATTQDATTTGATSDFKNTFTNIQCWDTQAPGFVYPEMQATNEGDIPFGYAAIQSRPNSGICISGGGSISASLIAGYFAALSDSSVNIMNNLRYISGVSGGTWGSAPYVYGGGPNFSGDVAMPADINLSQLTTAQPKGTMQYAAANADIADKCAAFLLEDKVYKNRVYERGVGACFLNPFGIESPASQIVDFPSTAQFFSSTAAMVSNIQQRNSGVSNKFMTMGSNMPFLIMNATMFVPMTEGATSTNYICPFEITPLYCGIKAPQTIPGTQNIGGFFVESFGFNTTLTAASANTTANVNSAGSGTYTAQATGYYPFELCQPVAASGSALEQMLETEAPSLLGCFPQFNYWNPMLSGTIQNTQYDFGDGGIVEDTGITSLLARGVDNIGVFLTEPVFFPGTDTIGCSGFVERVFGYNQIATLFGAPTIDADASVSNRQVEYLTPNLTKQVFENSQFQPLLNDLLAARTAGNGMVVTCNQMSVITNNLFGITPAAGYQPNVIWSVIDTATNWAPANSALANFISGQGDALADFPEVKVFGQNANEIIELLPVQTNLLADFGYWMVMNNASAFTSVLNSATTAAHTASAEAVA